MSEYGSGGFGSRGNPPVEVGDEIDVKIEAVGEKGDGIARKEGFVLFVPNTKEGDTVRVRVTKVLQKLGFAEVIGEAQEEPEEAAPAEAMEESPEAVREEAQEDTEHFGEEPVAEEAPEKPKEKAPKKEAPGEEPEEKPAEQEKEKPAAEEKKEPEA